MSESVGAVVLAAGKSTRWGTDNKLAAMIDGRPMLMRTLDAVLGSKARPVILVAGHDASSIRSLTDGLPLSVVEAARFADGMAESLKTGIAAVPDHCAGALICLGDMPFIRGDTLDRLIQLFDASGPVALLPTYEGRRGNPVLIGRALFRQVESLTGDQGARRLFSEMPDRVREIPVDDPGILQDLDSPG